MSGVFPHRSEYQFTYQLIEEVKEELEEQFSLYGLVSRYLLPLKIYHKLDQKLDEWPRPGEDGYDLVRMVLSELKAIGLRLLYCLKQADEDCREDLRKFSGISFESFEACVEELQADEQAFLNAHTEHTSAAAIKRI